MSAHARIVPVCDEERAVISDRAIARAVPRVRRGEDVHHFRGVTCAVGLHGIRAHGARAGVAMDDLICEWHAEQRAFVYEDAGGRTRAGLQKIWHDAGIVQVPVPLRDFRFEVRALRLPARAGLLVGVAEVAVVHHVIDAHALVAVVVVVALPHRAERIHGDLVVVAEVVPERLDIARHALFQINVAAEHHALPVGRALVRDFIADDVLHDLSVGPREFGDRVARVEIKFPVRSEDKCVDLVIEIPHAADFEKHLRLFRLVVAVGVGEQPHIRRGAHDHALAFLATARAGDDADAKRIRHLGALVESRLLVGESVAVRVFENHHAVAFGTEAHVSAVVHALGRPHAAVVIDVNVRRVLDHRLRSEERCLQPRGSGEIRHRLFRILDAVAVAVRKGRRLRVQRGENDEGGDGSEEDSWVHGWWITRIGARTLAGKLELESAAFSAERTETRADGQFAGSLAPCLPGRPLENPRPQSIRRVRQAGGVVIPQARTLALRSSPLRRASAFARCAPFHRTCSNNTSSRSPRNFPFNRDRSPRPLCCWRRAARCRSSRGIARSARASWMR